MEPNPLIITAKKPLPPVRKIKKYEDLQCIVNKLIESKELQNTGVTCHLSFMKNPHTGFIPMCWITVNKFLELCGYNRKTRNAHLVIYMPGSILYPKFSSFLENLVAVAKEKGLCSQLHIRCPQTWHSIQAAEKETMRTLYETHHWYNRYQNVFPGSLTYPQCQTIELVRCIK